MLGPDVEVRLVPDNESTGAAIVRVAHEMNADVLVIGSSGKNWLRRHFGGSVSDYVTHHAPCPVMLIRQDTEYGATNRPTLDHKAHRRSTSIRGGLESNHY